MTLAKVKKEWKNPRIHSYWPTYVVSVLPPTYSHSPGTNDVVRPLDTPFTAKSPQARVTPRLLRITRKTLHEDGRLSYAYGVGECFDPLGSMITILLHTNLHTFIPVAPNSGYCVSHLSLPLVGILVKPYGIGTVYLAATTQQPQPRCHDCCQLLLSPQIVFCITLSATTYILVT